MSHTRFRVNPHSIFALYVGPNMSYLGICGSNFEKLLSYLKSTFLTLSNCNILKEKKMHKFGSKNALFECFWAGILKKYCHI